MTPVEIAKAIIMAHRLRGWLQTQIQRAVRQLPVDCPLCGLAARGGDLCAGCAVDVLTCAHEVPARCQRCALALPRAGMACPDCMARAPEFVRVIAAFDYAPPLDGLVLALKKGGRLSRAKLFGRLLAESVRTGDEEPRIDALTYIPASRASLRERGFNPAGEIARALGTQLGLPVHPAWLQRTRESGRQSRLGRADRRRGAQGLYRCPITLPPLGIAVVDDVMTTGSTLNAAALALKAAGAAYVVGVMAARTPYV